MPRTLNIQTRKVLSSVANIVSRGIAYEKDVTSIVLDEYKELFLYGPYGVFRGSKNSRKSSKFYNTFTSLRQGGYIERKNVGEKAEIVLTDKGRLTILADIIKDKTKQAWDGKWRIFMFDVPEETRNERDFLRRYLKDFGAKELQKSVWVSPHDIEEEFNEFLKLLNKNIEGDLRIMTIEKINRDDDLRDMFGV